jgi:hypothetical protein
MLSELCDLKFKFPLFEMDGLIDLKDVLQLVQSLNSELDPMSIGFKRDPAGTAYKYNYNYWSTCRTT